MIVNAMSLLRVNYQGPGKRPPGPRMTLEYLELESDALKGGLNVSQ